MLTCARLSVQCPFCLGASVGGPGLTSAYVAGDYISKHTVTILVNAIRRPLVSSSAKTGPCDLLKNCLCNALPSLSVGNKLV